MSHATALILGFVYVTPVNNMRERVKGLTKHATQQQLVHLSV